MFSRRAVGIRGAVTLLALGVVVAVLALSPASAHHTPPHTKKMVKKVQRSVNRLRGTVNNLNQLQYMASAPLTVADGTLGQAEAICPAGTFVTGGGGVSTTASGIQVDSYPSHGVGFPPPSLFGPHGRTAWAFEWVNISGADAQIRAYAICSGVGTTGGNYTPGQIPFRQAPARTAP